MSLGAPGGMQKKCKTTRSDNCNVVFIVGMKMDVQQAIHGKDGMQTHSAAIRCMTEVFHEACDQRKGV
eukprot:374259-Amphidinium_carterae.1